MAREVAIKINVNGTDTAVKNISELETAIEQLRDELKGVDIGSEEFGRLSGELQNAESKLKTLNKSFEGLEPQQKAEAFVKLGEGIAGSFAIATAALTAFGVESEEVEQAQLAVTQALTAAIGARQIAEAGLQLRVAATTISQAAYNAAATAGNAITKAFYTTIAANPIGAIVTAVAALAAGIIYLTNQQKKQISVQEQVNNSIEEAEAKTIGYTTELSLLGETINDTNQTQKDRELALRRLQTILPELEGLELNNAEAIRQANTAIEKNIQLSIAQAKTEGLKQFIVQKTQELVEEQNSSLDDNLSFWEETYNFIVAGGDLARKSILDVGTAVENTLTDQKRLQDEITEATEQYEQALRNELRIQKEVDAGREEAQKRLKAQQNQTKKAEEALRNLIATRNENVKRLIADIQSLGRVLSFDYGEPKVLQDLREIENRLTILGKGELGFEDAVAETFGNIIEGSADVFGTRYDEFRERLSESVITSGKELNSTIAEVTREAAELVQTGDISIDAFVALQRLTAEYANLNTLLLETPPITDKLGDVSYYEALKQFLIQSGQIIFEEVDGSIQLLDKSTESYQTALLSGQGNLRNAEEQITKTLAERLVEQGYDVEQAQEIAEARVKSITELSIGIITQEEQIRGFLFETQKVQNRINEQGLQNLDTTNDAYKNFVLQNTALLTKFYDDILDEESEFFDQQRLNRQELEDLDKALSSLGLEGRKSFFTQRKIDAEDLFQLESVLAQQGIFLEDLTADEKLRIIEEFYNRKKELRDKDKEEEDSAVKDGVSGLAEGLRQVSQVAQTGVQVFQEYVSTQLTLLQEQEARVLDQIVGDSEEANQKRIEVQEEYESRRKEITKQGQLAQLQLTRIQAVANVAEAVTKALTEGPLIGQVLAGIAAAIGVAQVGIVSNQISQVRSLARGGLLEGPSHEYGGIPLAGGGVVAEGGEAVINRRGSIDYRNLLNEVSMSSGGAPMVASSFDDTRLIEAITKQNREPIKAFVLEQDITNSQSVNKRLQQLSKI